MKTLPASRLAGIILIGCLLLAGGSVSAAGIQVYMGDIVTLQGYSTGSPTVYLFLTGPNLPVNGVALDNINARADEGHFTEVDVDSNDHWIYRWGTNSVGGSLDAGTYTVWVVDSPTDRSHVGEHELPYDLRGTRLTGNHPRYTRYPPGARNHGTVIIPE